MGPTQPPVQRVLVFFPGDNEAGEVAELTAVPVPSLAFTAWSRVKFNNRKEKYSVTNVSEFSSAHTPNHTYIQQRDHHPQHPI